MIFYVLLIFLLWHKLGFRLIFNKETLKSKLKQETKMVRFEENPKTLSIVSHNLWCHYLVLAPQRMERLKILIDHIEKNKQKYQLFCFQELFLMKLGPLMLFKEVEYVIKEMKRLGFYYFTSPFESLSESINLKMQNSGLITFSKFPILESNFYPFISTGENVNNKGFQFIKLKVGNKQVHIINAHLDGSGSHRMKQVDQISDYMKEKGHYIAVGDFNVNSINNKGGEFEYLEKKMKTKDQSNIFFPEKKTFRTKPSFFLMFFKQLLGSYPQLQWPSKELEDKISNPNLNLDHCFVSDSFVVKICERLDIRDELLPLSDHFGLHLVLDFVLEKN